MFGIIRKLFRLLSPLPVFATTPSAVAVPSSHPLSGYVGVSCPVPGTHTLLNVAGVIFIINSGIPWIPVNGAPKEDARVFVLDKW